MLTPEELAIIRDVAGQINQTAGYSYHVLVQGTVILNLINLISIGIWCLLMFIVIKRATAWAAAKTAKDSYSDANFIAAMSVTCIAIAIGFVIAMAADAVGRIVVPEYYVLNTIIGAI